MRRKKLRQLSTTHWCRVAGDFHGVASRFLAAKSSGTGSGWLPKASLFKSIVFPCAMKPSALGLLLGTRGASTCFPPRCGLPRDGPRGLLHPGQFFGHVRRFSHLLKRNKTWDTSVALSITATAVIDLLESIAAVRGGRPRVAYG